LRNDHNRWWTWLQGDAAVFLIQTFFYSWIEDFRFFEVAKVSIRMTWSARAKPERTDQVETLGVMAAKQRIGSAGGALPSLSAWRI
jgi:hypothetical protein